MGEISIQTAGLAQLEALDEDERKRAEARPEQAGASLHDYREFSPNMELSKKNRSGRHGELTCWRKGASIPRFESRSVVVAVDATKKPKLAALQFALENIVKPGDSLYLLGVLHQVLTKALWGYIQKTNITQFTKGNKTLLQEEMLKKLEKLQKTITDKDIQKLFSLKQVIPDVRIGAGPERKVVTARQAAELGAGWVILDKHLEKDKAYLVKHLNCNIVLMKPKNSGKNEAVVLRVELPPGDNCETPKDLSPTGLKKTCRYNQIANVTSDFCDTRHCRIQNILTKLPSRSYAKSGDQESKQCLQNSSELTQEYFYMRRVFLI